MNKLAIQRIRRLLLRADRRHPRGRSAVLHRPSLLTGTRMVRDRPQVWATRSLIHELIATSLVVVASLEGCSSLSRSSLGIRPPPPDARYGEVDPCMRLDEYLNYSRDLQEAYHSRASQNRFWIYVAGTLGLATIAASGGLAAAAVSTTTIAIVAFAGGFYSSFFAFLGNTDLAQDYTTAADAVSTADSNARAAAALDKAQCAQAYADLVKAVSNAANQLEDARTTSAVAALKRAKEQNADLSAKVDTLQAALAKSSVVVNVPPSITEIFPNPIDPASPVTLTVFNVNFDTIARVDLKVKLVSDGVPIQVLEPPAATDRPNVYTVRFMPPKDPPSPQPPDGYSPEIVVKESLTIRGNVKLKYK